jgi:hypothetical protein
MPFEDLLAFAATAHMPFVGFVATTNYQQNKLRSILTCCDVSNCSIMSPLLIEGTFGRIDVLRVAVP